MNIGLIKSVKNTEHRVFLIPDAINELVSMGHNIFIENGAGEASRRRSFPRRLYLPGNSMRTHR